MFVVQSERGRRQEFSSFSDLRTGRQLRDWAETAIGRFIGPSAAGGCEASVKSFSGSLCSQPTLPASAMQTQFANCRAARRKAKPTRTVPAGAVIRSRASPKEGNRQNVLARFDKISPGARTKSWAELIKRYAVSLRPAGVTRTPPAQGSSVRLEARPHGTENSVRKPSPARVKRDFAHFARAKSR